MKRRTPSWDSRSTARRSRSALPPGIAAQTRLPIEGGKQAWIDGTSVEGEKRDGYLLLEVTAAGKHEIEAGK
jgi:hypothetical protein